MEGSTEELRRGEGRRKQLTSRVGLILRRSRAARGGPGRRKLDRSLLIGRSRIPHRAGCSHRRIMVVVLVRIDGWWKRSSTDMGFNVRIQEASSSTYLAQSAALGTAAEFVVFTHASALIFARSS